MKRHPDSDYMALAVMRDAAHQGRMADLLCWAIALVSLAAMIVIWWPL